VKSRKVAFWGNFGRGNLGNERTLQAIIHSTRKHLPGADLICVCTGPEKALELHNIPTFPISDHHRMWASSETWFGHSIPPIRLLQKVLLRVPVELCRWSEGFKTLGGTDMLIMAGTGVLTDSGERLWGASYEILKWSLIAKLCRCKLLFVSVGVEPTRRLVHRWFIRAALSLADYRSYRDDYSKQYLEMIGFDTRKDPIYPDLAFSLAMPMFSQCKGDVKIRSIIGVGVMDYCGQGGTQYGGEKTYLEYIRKMAAFVAWLLEHEYTVRVLIGDMTYDSRARQDLKQLLENRGFKYEDGQVIDEPASSVEELIALMLNKSVLSISYNEKNDCLLAGVGLAQYCHRIDQLDIDGLIKQFIELEANAERLRPQVQRKIEEYRKALDEQYALLYKYT
jgi:polysaccharide pyruvyl transferase WcaK-like protein